MANSETSIMYHAKQAHVVYPMPNLHVLRAEPMNGPERDDDCVPSFQSICATTLGMIVLLALMSF
jgi:hypothetical protein